jgi:hypothetical protein
MPVWASPAGVALALGTVACGYAGYQVAGPEPEPEPEPAPEPAPKPDDDDSLRLFATCNLGLEFIVAEEVSDKLPGAAVAVCTARRAGGKCFFTTDCPVELATRRLQSPEQIYALVAHIEGGLSMDAQGLTALHSLATDTPQTVWDAALLTWRRAVGPTAAASPTFSVRCCRRHRSRKHKYSTSSGQYICHPNPSICPCFRVYLRHSFCPEYCR